MEKIKFEIKDGKYIRDDDDSIITTEELLKHRHSIYYNRGVMYLESEIEKEIELYEFEFECKNIKIQNYDNKRLDVKVKSLFLSEDNVNYLLEKIGIEKLKKVVDSYR
jgi:hypothetical protein